MMVAYTFANANMAFYPPPSTTSRNSNTALERACWMFMDDTRTPFQRLSNFFIDFLGNSGSNVGNEKEEDEEDDDDAVGAAAATCFNMSRQVPYGPKGTISGGDWSGVGSGYDGDSWDFQTCTQLVETISVAGSMFPTRDWTIDWLSNHCSERFNSVQPDPNYSNDNWLLNATFAKDTITTLTPSYILFTNGNHDGWSVSGVPDDLSDTVRVINFPNGAHHSDLNRKGPDPDNDSDDITAGYKQIEAILSDWIDQVIMNKQKEQEREQEVLTILTT
jgi:Serine carboxypeptidase S28